MNKVFTLTIIPATKYAKELLVISVAPGVPGDMLLNNMNQMRKMAEMRKADWTMVKDVDVRTPQTFWQFCKVWWAMRQMRKAELNQKATE